MANLKIMVALLPHTGQGRCVLALAPELPANSKPKKLLMPTAGGSNLAIKCVHLTDTHALDWRSRIATRL